mgnify:CR=1 FL=1
MELRKIVCDDSMLDFVLKINHKSRLLSPAVANYSPMWHTKLDTWQNRQRNRKAELVGFAFYLVCQ